MNLETVTFGSRSAIVAHGDGQEVKLYVRVLHTCLGADEGASIEVVGGAGAGSSAKPLGARPRLAEQAPMAVQGYGLPASHLHGDFQVVLQVPADAGPVGGHRNPQLGQLVRRPDAGQQEQFGRVDGRGGENHFPARADQGDAPPLPQFDAFSPTIGDPQ